MNSKFIISILIIFCVLATNAQNRIAGFVKDKRTGEALIGAYITEQISGKGTATDNIGFFSLLVSNSMVSVSYIGYKSQQVPVISDSIITIFLEEDSEYIETVTVVGHRATRFNVASLSSKEIDNIPTLGGKTDVLKIIQLLPGIQATQEGSSQISVRGGSPGENLYLFDGVPIIYVSHLGGFMSVFNPDMINSLEVYKGGFPAKYGGKLSSIVNITQREGNKSGHKGSLSVGVMDASFVAEGPALQNKASYIITGRKTLYDPLFVLASGLGGGNYYFLLTGFHDINGKFSWRPNAKNSFHFNLYQGDDYLKYWTKPNGNKNDKSKQTHTWGNWLAAGRWNTVVNNSLVGENIVSYTRYRLRFYQKFQSPTETGIDRYMRESLSTVSDVSLRSNWNYNFKDFWTMGFGASASILFYTPNRVINTTATTYFENDDETALEAAAFFFNSIDIGKYINADLGLRAVHYSAYDYSNFKLEPRISINLMASKNHSFNLSFQDVGQNAHLLMTSGAIMNNEIWAPVGKGILPARSTQYSVGWKAQWMEGMFQSEVSVYKKEMSNLSTYKEGYSSLLGDGGWRTKVESGGSGHSHGLEILLQKGLGEWTGMLGYTYSRTTRQYPNKNRGESYPYDFDRPHSLAFNLGRKFSERISFNATWVYQTGLPYTPALGQQLTVDNKVALIYGDRNSARMIDYHRLDIGLKYKKTSKHGRRAEWTFSVYNLYSRKNAYYYYYDNTTRGFYIPGEDQSMKLYKANMFPIIPSFAYKVYFDGDKRTRNVKKDKVGIGQKFMRYMQYEN